MKSLIGERGSAVLHGTTHTIFLAGDLGKRLQSIKVELYTGDGPIRQDHATMCRPGLHADFGDSLDARPRMGTIPAHKSSEVLHRAVLFANFPDFATN
ncbi:hypothetical protein ES703_63482 [subsurface metagenome]